MKTRNLKTDMTEFQWWWSNFLNIKKSHDDVESFWPNWMRKRKRTFIKQHHTRCPFHQLMWHFPLISSGESDESDDNWNIFTSIFDWRDLRHHQFRVTKEKSIFNQMKNINYFFLFVLSYFLLMKETLLSRKLQWVAIKRDIEWMWKKIIGNCGLLLAFNGLMKMVFYNSSPCIIITMCRH